MHVLLRSRNVIEVCHRHDISNLTESTGLPTKRAEKERASKEESETRGAEASAREVEILDGCYPKATGWRNKRECIYLCLSISPKVRDISLLILLRPWDLIDITHDKATSGYIQRDLLAFKLCGSFRIIFFIIFQFPPQSLQCLRFFFCISG